VRRRSKPTRKSQILRKVPRAGQGRARGKTCWIQHVLGQTNLRLKELSGLIQLHVDVILVLEPLDFYGNLRHASVCFDHAAACASLRYQRRKERSTNNFQKIQPRQTLIKLRAFNKREAREKNPASQIFRDATSSRRRSRTGRGACVCEVRLSGVISVFR
jgi:hypothetical protein